MMNEQTQTQERTTPMEASLNEKEAELLLHRLEGPDDLIHVVFGFDDPEGESPDFTEAQGDEAMEILTKQVRSRTIKTGEWNGACPEVLAEMLEGSTYCAAAASWGTTLELCRAVKTLKQLEKKLEPLVGRVIYGADC